MTSESPFHLYLFAKHHPNVKEGWSNSTAFRLERSHNHKALKLALGIGLGLGIPVLVALVALGTWVCIRERQRSQKTTLKHQGKMAEPNSIVSAGDINAGRKGPIEADGRDIIELPHNSDPVEVPQNIAAVELPGSGPVEVMGKDGSERWA